MKADKKLYKMEEYKPIKRHGFSQYRGVTKTPTGRWVAQITISSKTYHVGSYATEIEAAHGADQAYLKHYGTTRNFNVTG